MKNRKISRQKYQKPSKIGKKIRIYSSGKSVWKDYLDEGIYLAEATTG